MNEQSNTLVLGLGNDVLTDDSIGLRVAAALRDRFAGQETITVVESCEMGLALLDVIVGFHNVVIIDAIQTGQTAPGFVHELEVEGLPALSAGSPHFLGITETLALGKELGLVMPDHVKIFAIEVEDPFTVGTRLTRAMEAALPGIIERVGRSVLA